MRRGESIACALATLFLVMPGIALSQGTNQNQTLIINGQSTQVSVIQVNGHSYVALEALANAVNGSLSTGGNQIALTLNIGAANSSPSASAAPPASASAPAPNPHFSRGFLNAGIEQMATVREWHAALATAIQNGYPLTTSVLAPYRAQATTNLRFAQVAVSTDSDRSGFQLLNNVFQNMGKLADKYVALRASMTYISPDALDNDSLNQRLVACGHSLSAMAASGQFVDDGSCN